MMPNRIHDARTYEFRAGEEILPDANVLLYLQPPPVRSAPELTWGYVPVFRRLQRAQAVPVADALVLSEYFNRFLRLEYAAFLRQRAGGKPMPFKEFRSSRHGLRVLAWAVAEVEEVVTQCRAKDTSFETLDLQSILKSVVAGTVDFNDGILIANCQRHGWKLLTNDGDMTIVALTSSPPTASC